MSYTLAAPTVHGGVQSSARIMQNTALAPHLLRMHACGEQMLLLMAILFTFAFIFVFCVDASGQCGASITGLDSSISFSIPDRGAAIYSTSGASRGLTVGYAAVQATTGS